MASVNSDNKSVIDNPDRPLFGFQGTVMIKVGAEERSFIVHKDLLRRHSPYFDGALSGNFRDSEENVISLPNDNPDVFEIFVDWLYALRLNEKSENVRILMNWRNLAQLYVFADMRGVLRLKDALVTLFAERFEKRIVPSRHEILREIPYIYANTVEKSLLRKPFVGYAVFDAVPQSKLTDFKEYLTAEFLLEVTLKLEEYTKERGPYAPYDNDFCMYHEHGPDQSFDC